MPEYLQSDFLMITMAIITDITIRIAAMIIVNIITDIVCLR